MKKIVGMILGILLMSNVSISAYGSTSNIDKLYSTAFKAVEICKKSYTQQSVNNARSAINDLQNTEAFWAIGEFSKQVDVVQNHLFSTFMNYFFSYDYRKIPKDYVPQNDINKARALVLDFDSYPGNKPYIASWSSTVDKYQQKIIDETLGLITIAENTGNVECVAAAKCGVNKLMTAKNNLSVIDFTKRLDEKVNSIKIKNGNINDYDAVGDVYNYKNYVRTVLDDEGDVEFKVKYEELAGWQRGGFVSPQHDVSNTSKYVDYFKSGDYYKGISTYSCVLKRDYMLPTGQENYSEIVRLVDGQVLIRAWENGKIEEFVPTALTKSQVEKYKNSSYDELLKGLK